jgi:8-oxo-dGTP diphosphatase
MSAYAPIEVGVEAYIVRDNQVLFGKRKNVYGAGTWGLPGGRIEFMERADTAIIRELEEETGVKIEPANLSLLALTDDPQPQNQAHHLHITFKVDIGGQSPIVREPEACEAWSWFPLAQLPAALFPPHKKILATIDGGQPYANKN